MFGNFVITLIDCDYTRKWFGLGLWCLTPLLTILQFYKGEGNQNTQRKPPNCHKSLISQVENDLSTYNYNKEIII